VPAPSADPPLRQDALRNRRLLLEAAARAFRAKGLQASVNAIAADAGVNVATLYRHFPSKEELLHAVLEATLEPLVVARDEALAADGDQLATFVHHAVRLQAAHRGLIDAIAWEPESAEVRARLRDPAVAIVAPLVEAAHRRGELRGDLDATDVLVALRMLAALPEPATSSDPRYRPERYVDLLLAAMR